MPGKEKGPLDYDSRPTMGWYEGLWPIFWVLFHTLWPLRVRGAHNVPPTGRAIIVSNHLSLVDPFVVAFAARRLVRFMAKEELFRTPIIGFIIRRVGAFPVNRSRRDALTMRTALTVLKEEGLLGMFPEGTRSTTGELMEFRAGALRLAARTRSTIVPVAVHGTDRGLPPKKWVRPARIAVTFGAPFEVPELYDRNDRGEALERAVKDLHDKIHELQLQHELGGKRRR